MTIIEKALEYIFLPSCGICGKLGEGYLCKKCGNELIKYEINSKNIINYEGKNIKSFHVFKYEDLVRNLMIQYKFNDKSYLYKTFCEIITKNKKAFDFIKSYDIIIPVPIHKKRMNERGYNQSVLIAKNLAKTAKIKCYTNILEKKYNNYPQSTLNKNMRKENVKNAYKLINSEKINGKKILIFDDIYTTGATINECIKEIEKANIEQIGIITLAKD